MNNQELLVKITKCTIEEASILLSRAEQFLLSETNRARLNQGLTSAQLELAIILFNREGMEGEGSRSEGGISISIIDLPEGVRRNISMNRLARVSGHAFEKPTTADTTIENKSN